MVVVVAVAVGDAMSEMWLWEPTLLLRWRWRRGWRRVVSGDPTETADFHVLEQLWRGRKVDEPLPVYALEEWREVPVVEEE